MNNIYVFSTLYPQSKKYFQDFINSVNNQTNNNFTLFLCLNDVMLSNKLKKKIKVKYLTVSCNYPASKARLFGLNKLLKLKPSHIITLDSDDKMKTNRVEKCIKEIKKNDFLVNNLVIFGKNIQKKVWFNNLRNNFIINLDALNFQNFVGLTNLTIKGKALQSVIKSINCKLVAFDWCLAKLLVLKNKKGIFKKNIYTYYRQHNKNISGIKNFSKKILLNDIKNKTEHLVYFKKFGLPYKNEIKRLKKMNLQLRKRNNLYKTIKKKLSKTRKEYWWSHI